MFRFRPPVISVLTFNKIKYIDLAKPNSRARDYTSSNQIKIMGVHSVPLLLP